MSTAKAPAAPSGRICEKSALIPQAGNCPHLDCQQGTFVFFSNPN